MVILYRDSNFFNAQSMLDFVCWGTPNESQMMRKEVEGVPWQGPCTPAVTSGVIHRRAGTSGDSAASYDTTQPASPMACP